MGSLWGKRAIVALFIFFGAFSLFQASWLASAPGGQPKLVASGPVDTARGDDGCAIEGGLAYGAKRASLETRMLQTAAGFGADAIVIDGEMANGVAVLPRFFAGKCAKEDARPRTTQAEAMALLSKPDQFVRVTNAAHARAVLGLAETRQQRRIFFGPDMAVAEIKGKPAFSIEKARSCASEYRLSGLWGAVPESCRDGTILLGLNDLGFTLWGWPNRFLARMDAANVRPIITAKIDDGQIIGLTRPDQYNEIASSYNGYIWIDNIEELGPALKR